MSNNVVIIVADEVPVGTLLAVAKRAGTDVKAVVAGSRALADTVATGGVASVAWIDVPEAMPVEAFVGTVAEEVKALEPGVVLAPNAAASRVLAGASPPSLMPLSLRRSATSPRGGCESRRATGGRAARC